MPLAVWDISTSGPRRLLRKSLPSEKSFEAWIENDPEMVEGGLRVIGRQVHLASGIADLLAVDVQGRLAVVELKRQAVGRFALAQALGYAAELALSSSADISALFGTGGNPIAASTVAQLCQQWDDEGANEVRVILVGLEADASLARVADLFARYRFPLAVVTFQSFQAEDGRYILVRTLTDAENDAIAPSQQAAVTIGALRERAMANHMGEPFDAIYSAAVDVGINPRPRKRCVMFAPPTHAGRTLFTLYPTANGYFPVYVSTIGFTEFYPVTQEQVEEHLGSEGWHNLKAEEALRFAEQLRHVFALIEARHNEEEGTQQA